MYLLLFSLPVIEVANSPDGQRESVCVCVCVWCRETDRDESLFRVSETSLYTLKGMFKWCRSSRWKATDAFTARLYKQNHCQCRPIQIQISYDNINLLKHKQPGELTFMGTKRLDNSLGFAKQMDNTLKKGQFTQKWKHKRKTFWRKFVTKQLWGNTELKGE